MIKLLYSWSLLLLCSNIRIYAWNNMHSIPSPALNTTCLMVAENEYFTVGNKPATDKCAGFVCWESQLTLASKVNITRMYNTFRQKISKRKEIATMLKMTWHWALEKESMEIISNCSEANSVLPKVQKNAIVPGLDYSLSCESSITSVELKEASQFEFLESFEKLLKENALNDFVKDVGEFRRANVTYFGCALTITKSEHSRGYFACTYCSKETTISNAYDSCPGNTEKRYSSHYPFLCSSPRYEDLYACETENACSEITRPKVWETRYPGRVYRLYPVNQGEGIRLLIEEIIYQVEKNTKLTAITKPLYLWKPGMVGDSFFNYASLPRWSYTYDKESMKKLTKTLESVITSKNALTRKKRQYEDEDDTTTTATRTTTTTTEEPSPRKDEPPVHIIVYPAPCCSYIFMFMNTMSLLLVSAAIFSFDHFRKVNKLN